MTERPQNTFPRCLWSALADWQQHIISVDLFWSIPSPRPQMGGICMPVCGVQSHFIQPPLEISNDRIYLWTLTSASGSLFPYSSIMSHLHIHSLQYKQLRIIFPKGFSILHSQTMPHKLANTYNQWKRHDNTKGKTNYLPSFYSLNQYYWSEVLEFVWLFFLQFFASWCQDIADHRLTQIA